MWHSFQNVWENINILSISENGVLNVEVFTKYKFVNTVLYKLMLWKQNIKQLFFFFFLRFAERVSQYIYLSN